MKGGSINEQMYMYHLKGNELADVILDKVTEINQSAKLIDGEAFLKNLLYFKGFV